MNGSNVIVLHTRTRVELKCILSVLVLDSCVLVLVLRSRVLTLILDSCVLVLVLRLGLDSCVLLIPLTHILSSDNPTHYNLSSELMYSFHVCTFGLFYIFYM